MQKRVELAKQLAKEPELIKLRQLQLEMTELRNKAQQLRMSQRESFGTFGTLATALTALCTGVYAIEPASLSQLVDIITDKAVGGWLVAAAQNVTAKPIAADYIAEQQTRRMFFEAKAERRQAYMAWRRAARSAGQPRSMP